MRQYTLSSDEKKTLLGLAIDRCYPPDGISKAVWLNALRSLRNEGLARVAFIEGGGVEDAAITEEGRNYIEANPTMKNPVNWGKVAAIAAIISAVCAIVALFVACSFAFL